VPAIDDDFSVAAAAKPISERRELGTDFGKVLDFAVETYPYIPIGARHRLMTSRREVDDRQAGMGKPSPLIGPHAFIIRPAMPQGSGHPP